MNNETKLAFYYAKLIGADIKVLGFLQDHQPVTSIAALKIISAKTLIICGDEDKDNGNPHDLKTAIPTSEIKIVEGDHDGTYKQANFANAIIKFLKK